MDVTMIIVAVLGSQALVELIKWWFGRKDEKNGIKSTLKKLEKDGLRTQLLLLILLQPDEKKEILTLGQRYFSKPPDGLDGNWYMTGIFSKWCNERNLKPEWFEGKMGG